MNGYFQKLRLPVDFSTVNVDSRTLRPHGNYTAWQKYGIALKRQKSFSPATNASFYLDDCDKKTIIEQLPQGLLDIEIPDVWLLYASPNTEKESTGGGVVMLPPHVDGVRKCSINIYFETHGETTRYYEYESGSSIKEIGSFVAQVGEVYLLNSDRPHSVDIIESNPRRSISVSFIHTPYEIVEEYMRDFFT